MPVMLTSGSVRSALSCVPASGCNVDRVTVPSSSTLVTLTVTLREAVFPVLSVAVTVTSYMLFEFASASASEVGGRLEGKVASIGAGVADVKLASVGPRQRPFYGSGVTVLRVSPFVNIYRHRIAIVDDLWIIFRSDTRLDCRRFIHVYNCDVHRDCVSRLAWSRCQGCQPGPRR